MKSTVWLSTGVVAVLTVACTAERDELRYKRPAGGHVVAVTSTRNTAAADPSGAVASSPPSPVVESTTEAALAEGNASPAPESVDASPASGTAATASAREAARRAADAQRIAESAMRSARSHLDATNRAVRQVDGSSAAASASTAEQEAERAETAAREAETSAADARRAANEVAASAPGDPEGERLRRQSRDAASHAEMSAREARRAASAARSSAQEAVRSAELAAVLAAEQRRLDERVAEERARALEIDSMSGQATDTAEAAAHRALRAADEFRASDVDSAVADLRAEAERARTAARQLSELAAGAAAAASADPVQSDEGTRERDDQPPSAAAFVTEALEKATQEHARWLSDLAAIAAERLERIKAAEEQVHRLRESDVSSAPTAPLPEVPALPPERQARPSGVTEPERAEIPTVPDLGRFRQVEGGNAPDWLPGGYVESTVTLRADGLIEVRRVFPAHVEITWRAGYRWSDDRATLIVGEDDKSRPAAGTLLAFEGGPTGPVEPLPIRLRAERLAGGGLRLGGKTYAPAE